MRRCRGQCRSKDKSGIVIGRYVCTEYLHIVTSSRSLVQVARGPDTTVLAFTLVQQRTDVDVRLEVEDAMPITPLAAAPWMCIPQSEPGINLVSTLTFYGVVIFSCRPSLFSLLHLWRVAESLILVSRQG